MLKLLLIFCLSTIVPIGFSVSETQEVGSYKVDTSTEVAFIDFLEISNKKEPEPAEVFFSDALKSINKKKSKLIEEIKIIDHPNPIVYPIDPIDTNNGRWVYAKVTAYCPCRICCGSRSNGKTSTRVNVYSGNPDDAYGYAVDPRVIPYKTTIYVPGYWESIQRNSTFVSNKLPKADDTGSAMRKSWRKRGIIHIDCRYLTHAAAKNWGEKYMKVFIYNTSSQKPH